jgi:hypothetical protein
VIDDRLGNQHVAKSVFPVLQNTRLPTLQHLSVHIKQAQHEDDYGILQPFQYHNTTGAGFMIPPALATQLRSVVVRLEGFTIARQMRQFLQQFGKASRPEILKLRANTVNVLP